MALDEDLQEVPWGQVGEGHHHQIFSPLAALGATLLPRTRPTAHAHASPYGDEWRRTCTLPLFV